MSWTSCGVWPCHKKNLKGALAPGIELRAAKNRRFKCKVLSVSCLLHEVKTVYETLNKTSLSWIGLLSSQAHHNSTAIHRMTDHGKPPYTVKHVTQSVRRPPDLSAPFSPFSALLTYRALHIHTHSVPSKWPVSTLLDTTVLTMSSWSVCAILIVL